MKGRDKLDKYWEAVPESTDILVTHGPPKGILDLSRDRQGILEYCGDRALLRHSVLRIKPFYHIFGHVHNYEDCINQGTRIWEGITFINASVVTDSKFGELSSSGIIIEYGK
jgi:Icc-related predicted phosphoesterase